MIKAMTGNEAMAYAMKQINPDVVAAYPITPATEIVQIFSNYVADGEVDTEFVPVESEHSALSACVGAAVAGARVMTGTASQGLALMHEVLYIASGLRLPIVISLVNRALSSPINIHCDHSDTMGSRDSGWIQIYCESTQEAYDSVIQAVKIAEKAELPVIVSTDAFILSHSMERIETISDEDVQNFIGEKKFRYNFLDPDNPIMVGPLDLQDYFFEHKREQIDAMNHTLPVIKEVAKEYGEKFGRFYPVVERYRLEDAEIGIVVLGSTAGTAKDVVDELREQGKKVGLLRIRVFRPLPVEDIRDSLKHLKVVGVMDRSDSLNSFGGPVFGEVRSALYDLPTRPLISNYVYGLGGREVDENQIREIFAYLEDIKDKNRVDEPVKYIGVRGG